MDVQKSAQNSMFDRVERKIIVSKRKIIYWINWLEKSVGEIVKSWLAGNGVLIFGGHTRFSSRVYMYNVMRVYKSTNTYGITRHMRVSA